MYPLNTKTTGEYYLQVRQKKIFVSANILENNDMVDNKIDMQNFIFFFLFLPGFIQDKDQVFKRTGTCQKIAIETLRWVGFSLFLYQSGMTSTLSKVHCNNELNCTGLLTTQIHKIHNLHVNNNKQEAKD